MNEELKVNERRELSVAEAWPDAVVDFDPTPETLGDLPAPVINFAAMDTPQIVAMVAGYMKSEASVEEASTADDQSIAVEGARARSLMRRLMIRDLRCLAARDLDRGEQVAVALADSPDGYARAEAPQLLSTLLRLENDDPDGRVRVIRAHLALLDDEDDIVRECAADVIAQLTYADWLDERTARFLNSKLPYELGRPDWLESR